MRAHRLLIPLAALLAILPLLLKGPSCGHDFDFHLLSWLEASTQLAHGAYPHWAFTPAYNAGEPRFVFYPPLSWLLGALLGLLLPALGASWTAVPAVYTWLCLTLSGFTAHALARRYAPAGRAPLLVAILYLANPYLLFCAYERTAYGELLAAAWFPLLLLAALPAPAPPAASQLRSARPILGIAVSIALLWLTNAPAAVMGCYALAILTAIRLCLRNRPPQATRLRLTLTTSAGTLLGLLLPAFYLLPAAYERRFIQAELATVEGMRPIDSTLFHHMTPIQAPDLADTWYHDQVVHTASLLALLLLAALLFFLVFNWQNVVELRTKRYNVWASNYTLPTAILALVIAFLLTPWSLPVWAHTPQLAYLQFPWRLCALLAPLCIAPTAQSFQRLPKLQALAIPASLTLAAALVWPAYSSFAQACETVDNVPARVALFHSPQGTEATDEYTPEDADQEQLTPHNPPFWLLPAGADPNTGAPGTPSGSSNDAAQQAFAHAAGPAPQTLTLTPRQPEILVLNRRAYPAWMVLLNGHATSQLERNDGLIAVALPAGNDRVVLIFFQTADRTLGLVVSLLSLLLASFLFFARKTR